MADITRLFMAGAGPVRERPQRVPPKRVVEAPEVTSQEPELKGTPAEIAAPPLELRTETLPRVQMALAAGAGAFAGVVEAAKLLAGQHGINVGVIGRDGALLHVMWAEPMRGRGGARFTQTTFASPQAAIDVQIARTLYGLRQSVRHWIVAVPQDAEVAEQLLEAGRDWLVVSGADNDAVIACYRTLKGLCEAEPQSRPGRTVRLMLRTTDHAEASRVHARLSQVAAKFLGRELVLVSPTQPASASAYRAGQFVLGGDPATAETAWMAVMDFLQELLGGSASADTAAEESAADGDEEAELGNVLADEERAALTAGLMEQEAGSQQPEEEPEQPAASNAKPVHAAPVVPAAPVVAAAPAAARAVEVAAPRVSTGPRLEVVEAETCRTRAGIASVVRGSVAGLLPGSVVLEARPPMDESGVLAVDAAGRLHVWTVTSPDNPTAWAALWQWATEHRELIALTRRDGRLDTTVAVGVHVVMPAEMSGAPLRSGPAEVKWYRMCEVQWGQRTGMVVVPVG